MNTINTTQSRQYKLPIQNTRPVQEFAHFLGAFQGDLLDALGGMGQAFLLTADKILQIRTLIQCYYKKFPDDPLLAIQVTPHAVIFSGNDKLLEYLRQQDLLIRVQ